MVHTGNAVAVGVGVTVPFTFHFKVITHLIEWVPDSTWHLATPSLDLGVLKPGGLFRGRRGWFRNRAQRTGCSYVVQPCFPHGDSRSENNFYADTPSLRLGQPTASPLSLLWISVGSEGHLKEKIFSYFCDL